MPTGGASLPPSLPAGLIEYWYRAWLIAYSLRKESRTAVCQLVAVQVGETCIITSKGTPVAQISPLRRRALVVARTVVVAFADLLAPVNYQTCRAISMTWPLHRPDGSAGRRYLRTDATLTLLSPARSSS